MNKSLLNRLESIREVQLHHSLTHMQRGLEKESLRVGGDGCLAQTPHPRALGSALTHQWITTDYSEALLEFITPVYQSSSEPLAFLSDLHSFAYQHLQNELLWVNSMPCRMGRETDIPIAEYGSSNVGRMKHVYRHGLWHRYGRYMQTIAGIHYNVSLPHNFWTVYHDLENSQQPLQDFISEQYFALIRNFLRNVGLVVYLFGASPAVCRSFLQNQGHPSTPDHKLETLGEHTCYLPYGTSLRMSDLGYHNDAQAGLNISYNSLEEYVSSLQHAIRTPYAPFANFGIQDNGIYKQLNTNLLQIENEFYSSIRPKRVTRRGERPTCALVDRGVEYVELRCVDLNPFLPLGISESQIRFLDVFVLYCLLAESPAFTEQEQQCNGENLQAIVNSGRDPELQLSSVCTRMPFRQWAGEHLENMLKVAQLLDQAHNHQAHSSVVRAQMTKLTSPELTPSGQIMQTLQRQQQSFFEFAMERALATAEYFGARALAPDRVQSFSTEARRSLAAQRRLEQEDTLTFDQYLHNFLAQDPCKWEDRHKNSTA
ncbi:MAG: glutamate--cysteine ligase [Pseudomonadota bacterium]|nr:glutamate--cysteine ligase [Pseudomonadota bacterium]